MSAQENLAIASADVRPNTACEASIRPDYSVEQQLTWMRRHEEFVQIARRGGIDVLFLGDSITDYWRTAGLSHWDKSFGLMQAANFGISGDRTQQVLWRIKNGELDGIKPRVVVLQIGTNNIDPGLGANSLTPANTSAEIVAGVSAVVQAVRMRLPGSVILLHGLFPRGQAAEQVRHLIADINSSLKVWAKSDPKISFIDLGALFVMPDGTLSPAIASDNLHLTALGYELWAAALEGKLNTILGRGIDAI